MQSHGVVLHAHLQRQRVCVYMRVRVVHSEVSEEVFTKFAVVSPAHKQCYAHTAAAAQPSPLPSAPRHPLAADEPRAPVSSVSAADGGEVWACAAWRAPCRYLTRLHDSSQLQERIMGTKYWRRQTKKQLTAGAFKGSLEEFQVSGWRHQQPAVAPRGHRHAYARPPIAVAALLPRNSCKTSTKTASGSLSRQDA